MQNSEKMQNHNRTHEHRGGTWLPIGLSLLAGVFLAVVIVQITRGPEPPGESQARGNETPAMPTDTATREREAPAALTKASTPLLFADLIANSGIDRIAEREAVVRAQIEEYFKLLSWDLSRKENLAHYKENRAKLEAYLASLPPEMVPLLLELLRDETDFMNCYHLIRALGEIGSDLAADGLMERFEYAIENHNQKEIERTIQALGIVDSDHSFDLLHDYIDDDRSGVKEQRHRFVRQLGLHDRREESIPLFIDLAEHDGDPRVRNKSAQALKRTADGSSLAPVRATAPEIERLLRGEQNAFVRQTMIGTLGSVGDQGSLTMLAEIARTDSDDSSRASAVESLYRIGGPQAEETLQEIAETDNDERVRDRARRRLRQLREDH